MNSCIKENLMGFIASQSFASTKIKDAIIQPCFYFLFCSLSHFFIPFKSFSILRMDQWLTGWLTRRITLPSCINKSLKSPSLHLSLSVSAHPRSQHFEGNYRNPSSPLKSHFKTIEITSLVCLSACLPEWRRVATERAAAPDALPHEIGVRTKGEKSAGLIPSISDESGFGNSE